MEENAKKQRISTLAVIMGGLLLVVGVSQYFLSRNGNGSSPIEDAFIDILLSLIAGTLIYLVVRLIRGWSRGLEPIQFILTTAVVVGGLGLLTQVGRSGTQQSATANTTTTTSAHGWPLPPLVAGNWQDSNTDQKDTRVVLDALVEKTPQEWQDQARSISRLRMLKLPSYPGAYLGEGLVSYSSHPAVFTFMAIKGGEIVLLDGTGTPILKVNHQATLNLTTSNQVENYLRFFSAAVSAGNGTVPIVDNVKDLDWSRSVTGEDKQRAAKYVRPLVLTPSSGGTWKASATVQYGSSIHNLVYTIHTAGDARGNVEISDDFLLAEGLPLRKYAFKGPLRYQIGGMQ